MFRKEIKSYINDIHRYVENLDIMKHIMNSTISDISYLKYLIQLYSIYNSIEHNEQFKKLGWNINFVTTCKKDIDIILNNISNQEILEITAIYSNYLKNITNTDMIVAHAYVRYMADFYGGTIIKKHLPSHLPLNVYKIDKSIKTNITDYIENNVQNKELFLSEVQHAFMAYSSILNKI